MTTGRQELDHHAIDLVGRFVLDPVARTRDTMDTNLRRDAGPGSLREAVSTTAAWGRTAGSSSRSPDTCR